MNKLLLLPFLLTGSIVLAHPGHPGPESHGDPTHFVVGILVGVPLAWGLWFGLRALTRSLSTAKSDSKETSTDG